MKLFVLNDHAGLKAARAAVFPAVAWQRCPFHLQHNAGAYAPNKALKKPVAAAIRAVFDAPDEAEAKRLIERFIRTCEVKAPPTRGVDRDRPARRLGGDGAAAPSPQTTAYP